MIFTNSKAILLDRINDVIRLVLMINDMTISQLANKLNVNQSTVSRWLKNGTGASTAINSINDTFDFILVHDYDSWGDNDEGYLVEFDTDHPEYDKLLNDSFTKTFFSELKKNPYPEAPTPSEQVNEPKVDYGNKDLHKIMLEVMEEATPEDKAVLGKYFIEVLRRYKGE
jgi:transcriptional regulator with XRE-family HTH domain